ncbi:MAG: hypothetical protein QXR19_07735 [Candidatus Jordarchaeaceae archaeon]
MSLHPGDAGRNPNKHPKGDTQLTVPTSTPQALSSTSYTSYCWRRWETPLQGLCDNLLCGLQRPICLAVREGRRPVFNTGVKSPKIKAVFHPAPTTPLMGEGTRKGFS